MLNIVVNIILFIFILGITVLVHEFGHYLFARLVGVHVYEFAIGMGPKLFSRKSKKTEIVYSIRAVPIGGFCSLAGEEVDVDVNNNRGKNLQDKTLIQRFLVMFMGVGFNFIFAFLIFFFLGLFAGAPNLDPIINDVAPNYPAAIAGISSKDKVLKINNKKVRYLDDIMLYITLSDLSQPITFEVEKTNGKIETYSFKAIEEKKDGKTTYVIGITLSSLKEKGLGKSFVYAFKQEGALFKQMYTIIGALFKGKLSINKLSGPIGIYTIVGDMKSGGVSSLLYLVALLCINVGVINLLPFPAFDGGRIVFLIIEKIKGSPISPKVENTIHNIGFILLILLMIYITINDIIKLF